MTDLALPDRPAELAAWADQLRAELPSLSLDVRVAAAIAELDAQRNVGKFRWSLVRRSWLTGPAVAACVVAIAMAALVLWAARARYLGAEPQEARAALDPRIEPAVQSAPFLSGPDAELASASSQRATGEPAEAFVLARSAPYSLWPTESAVFRVRTRLDASVPAFGDTAALAGERQFWVDVRVANDGSMRIVRIVPVDSGEVAQPESN